jgi:hypothetical protein
MSNCSSKYASCTTPLECRRIRINIKNFAIPSPCEEQKVIGEYLHKQLKIVDATLSTVHQEVKLLIEYKTSLICHAVTGKIDITRIKVPEFRADDIFPECGSNASEIEECYRMRQLIDNEM